MSSSERSRPSGPPWRLSLLGNPCISAADGATIHLPVGKPLAVACIVALEPSPVTRDDLAALLWGDASAQRARHSVRQALSTLRSHVGDNLLVESDAGLQLHPQVELDVEQFEQALVRDEIDLATELWQNGLLHGFDVAAAEPFMRWAETQRSAYHSRLVDALRARLQQPTPAFQRAHWLSTAMRLEPTDLQLHQVRIGDLLELNELDAAERALIKARRLVDDDKHGVLSALAQRLNQLKETSATSSAAAQSKLQLDMRAHDLRRLRHLWSNVEEGQPCRVALLGPRGSGKTRLIQQLADHVTSRGGRVVQVRVANPSIRLELGALAEAVRGLLRLPGAAGLSAGSSAVLQQLVPSRARLVPSHAPTLTSPANPVTLADALADLISAIADEAPLMLAFDDGQWFDELGLKVLIQAALRTSEGQRVLFVGSADTQGQIFQGLDVLQRERHVHVVALDPLTVDQIADTLQPVFPALAEPLLGSLAARLHHVGGGHPWRLHALLEGMAAEGLLMRTGAWWHPSVSTPVEALPPRHLAIDPWAQVLNDLPLLATSILHTLAHAEHRLTRAQLGRPADEPLSTALASLTDQRLLVWKETGQIDLLCDALRELIKARAAAESDTPSWRTRSRAWLHDHVPLRLIGIVMSALLAATVVLSLVSMAVPE